MLQDALDAFGDVLSPPLRGVLAKSLALSVALLASIGFGLERALLAFLGGASGWIATLLAFAVGAGLALALAWLAAPTASLAASFFFDEIADRVERQINPYGPCGRPAPFGDALRASLRFAALSLAVALAAIALLFLPGVGFLIWISANAYVLGGEYFELAAMRMRPAAEARELRRRLSAPAFLAGLIAAGFACIPLLNLLTPVFATALMVRVHKRLTQT